MKNQKNVLIIATAGLIGGVEKLFMAGLPLLRQKGYNFIFCLDRIDGPSTKAYQNMGFKCLIIRSGGGDEAVDKMKEIIADHNIDLIHDNEFCLPAAAAAKKIGIPHLIHLHSEIENALGGHSKLSLKKHVSSVCRLTDFAIGCSEFVTNQLKEFFNHEKIKCIRNGVPITKAPLLPKIGNHTKTVGMIANFYPVKRHRDFIIAAKNVLDSGFNTKFFIAGNCWLDNDDGELYLKNLRKLVLKLNLQKNFKFYRGLDDINHLYQQMDIFALPSASEGISIALLEAMQNGLPVIGTKTTGFPEVILDGYNGFLIEVGQPKKIARIIIKLLKNKNLALKAGQNARKTVRARFNIQRFADELAEIYHSLII